MLTQSGSAALPLQHLKVLKTNLFTGRLLVTGTTDQRWDLYLHLGRIVYVTGGNHAMRRWLRQLKGHRLSDVKDPYQTGSLHNFTSVAQLSEQEIATCWEYFVLRDALGQGYLSREAASALIHDILLEVLFDMQQDEALVVEIHVQEQLSLQLALFDFEQLWATAQGCWHKWKQNRLAKVFPDQAAVISRSARLRQEMSPAAFMALETLLDGRRSLREISAQTGRSLLEVASSLLLYIEAGNITLVEVPDLLDPAERFFSTYSQSGSLIDHASRDTIRDTARTQNVPQVAGVAG
jgi:two-component system, chemotaxis family, response regulator PixG